MSVSKIVQSVFLIVTLSLLTATSSFAIRFVSNGDQSLEGIVVRDDGQLLLVIDANSRSQQLLVIKGKDAGTQATLEKLAQPKKIYPERYSRADVREFYGTVASRVFRVVIFDEQDDTRMEAFRQSLTANDDNTVTTALTVLERSGALGKALTAAVAAHGAPRVTSRPKLSNVPISYDQLMVMFKPEVTLAEARKSIEEKGLEVVDDSMFKNLRILVVRKASN